MAKLVKTESKGTYCLIAVDSTTTYITTGGIKPCFKVASTKLSIGTLGSTRAVLFDVSIFKT